MAYLYETIVQEFGKRELARTEVPNTILDNLRPGYGQRPYQIEAFQRFILCYNEDFEGKPHKPFHLLYNMATGSGKTLEEKKFIELFSRRFEQLQYRFEDIYIIRNERTLKI